MTSIGSAQLLSSLTQLRTGSVAQSETQTTVAKALSEAQNITLDGSSTLLLRQNLNDTADLIAKVEVSSTIIDGVATRLVALENLEIQQMQLSQTDGEYAALSVQINNAQNELTDYVIQNIENPREWKIISDQTPTSDPYFDFEEWAYSLDTTLSTKLATLELKGEMLLDNLHVPANCFMCNAGNTVLNAGPTSTTTTVVGDRDDPSTTNTNWDSLRSGQLWNITGSDNLSYSYYSGVPYGDPYNGRAGGPEGTSTALNSTQQADHDAVMRAWDDVVDFEFEKITETDASNVGEIRIAYTSAGPSGSAAFAYYPWNNSAGGDAWYMTSVSSNNSFAAGTYGMFTALHEIGHAIGLKHPFQTGTGEGPILSSSLDNARNTVMTYNQSDRNQIWNFTRSGNSISASASRVNPITPMLYDVAFAQENYGMETSIRNNATSYTFTSAPEVLQTIVDGGGSDTINVSGLAKSNIINLNPGSFSSIGYTTIAEQLAAAKTANPGFENYLNNLYGATYTSRLYQWDDNVAIAYGTTIENAIGGSGVDTITGNSVDNEIWGNGGNDVIDGASGTDTAGYAGAYASYTISNNAGTLTVAHNNAGSDGTDTLTNIEFLKFSDVTYNVATQQTSATTAGAPTGTGQNASSTSAEGASVGATAATGSSDAQIVRDNTPTPSVAITYTAAEQRSVTNGRMAAIAGLSARLSAFNTSLVTTKSKAFHTMASMSSPAAASARAASRMSNLAEASRQVNFAPMTSAQPPRVPITAMNDFVKSMNVTNASLVAAMMRA
jgi:hypothetical protein